MVTSIIAVCFLPAVFLVAMAFVATATGYRSVGDTLALWAIVAFVGWLGVCLYLVYGVNVYAVVQSLW